MQLQDRGSDHRSIPRVRRDLLQSCADREYTRAPEYRAALQPAIEEGTLEFDGKRIAINRENTDQLIEAVRTLRARLETTSKPARDEMTSLQAHLDRSAGMWSGAYHRSEGLDRQLLVCMMDDHVTRLYSMVRAEDAVGGEIEEELLEAEA